MIFHQRIGHWDLSLGLRERIIQIQTLLLVSLCSVSSVSSLQAAPEKEINDLLKAFSANSSLRDSTTQSLVKIMEKEPAHPDVPKAFGWLIRNAGVSEGSDYDRSEDFFKRIEKHHANNEQLARALTAMVGFREKESIAFLERLGANSKNNLVSATALIALASSYEFDDEEVARYNAILKSLIEKHPDLKYGNYDITGFAKQKLYASENLRVGKVAPEIEGEDVLEKRFKLSDYRGKVVFLNFWGDW